MRLKLPHSFFPFFEGLPQSAYPRETLDEYNNRTVKYGGKKLSYYDATQVQRGMERAVRATKRELVGYSAGMKSADDPLRNALKEKFGRASVKLKRQEAKLLDFTRQTALDRQREREQALGFGRSAAQKAVWANKKVDIQRQNDILKEEIRSAGNLPKAAKIHLTPTRIDTDSLSFDDEHVNAERGHQVTREQAVKWIQDAKISVTVWGVRFERYYGYEETAYANLESKLIRTAYAKNEFDDNTRAILEVIEKHAL